MSIEAKIIADSISPDGIRLTTMQLRYPKFIHGELMTHRAFSRNASSSRAIPIERMGEDVRRDTATPVYWGAAQAGMQAKAEVEGDIKALCERTWETARDVAIIMAMQLSRAGLHKQIANRVLEPFACINTLVTATDWANFYALRRHPDAQPEIHALADLMWMAHQASTPVQRKPGSWHLPYVDWDDEVWQQGALTDIIEMKVRAVKVSVARCARLSYLTHDGKPTTSEADLALFDRLVGSTPLHASPAEHQATPDSKGPDRHGAERWEHGTQHGNFRGWRQYRKMLPNEAVHD